MGEGRGLRVPSPLTLSLCLATVISALEPFSVGELGWDEKLVVCLLLASDYVFEVEIP